jgi:hypothetical protein
MTNQKVSIKLILMKRLFLFVLAGLICFPLAGRATLPFYINSTNVTFPPQVDATNFVNSAAGTFSINTALPFDTSNTRNFTNRGSMTGSVGWRFDHAPSNTGLRKPADNFHNHPGATVTAVDGLAAVGIDYASKLLINATNIVNEGILSVDELGLMRLTGTNVILNRSGLQVTPLAGQGTLEDVDRTFFLPDIALLDDYWGIGTNTFFSAPIVTLVGTNAQGISPIHDVEDPNFGFRTVVFASPAQSFVYTNAGEPISLTLTNETGGLTNIFITTNRYVQVALVATADTNVGVRASFSPSEIDTNLFSTVVVELGTPFGNPVTGVESLSTLYVLDRLASTTNRNLSANFNAYPPTARPVNYQVSRVAPFEFFIGTGANEILRTNTVYDPLTMTNRVTGLYAGYGVTADLLTQVQPVVAGASITNIPGRIEINAGTLDMTKTRIRSDGLVALKTPHLISSTNVNMDAWNLSFDLSSTNGNLRIQNLAKTEVRRFGGNMVMWSGLWDNVMREVITNNYAPDPADTNLFIPSPITNIVAVGIHVLILDATGLGTLVPVQTHNFTTRNTDHLTLADPLLIVDTFHVGAERMTIEATNGSITLSGGFTISGGITEWTGLNTPNLKYLTNFGTIEVPNGAHFGDDRVTGYKAFVNKGNVLATGLFVRSEYFENSGLLDSFSLLSVETTSGRMENSSSIVDGDFVVQANDFKLRSHTNQTLGALYFTITNSLFDSGSSGVNRLVCGDGFHFHYANGTGKPLVGDLLGTTIETAAPIFASIDHTWPGDDKGADAAGFTNNLALGRLVLSIGFDAEILINGAGVSNALYVDYLEFIGITLAEVEAALRTAPNLVIYFADSNLPAEQLDGLLGGHLRWVSGFAGPNSSIDLLINGQVVKVNRALRQSLIIDSDGDGLANGFDPSPFDPAVLTLSLASSTPLTLALNWTAAASTVYKVEYTTNNKDWHLLQNYTNSAATTVSATVLDQVPAGSPQRYYRVGYKP